jgi:hypothetical protein
MKKIFTALLVLGIFATSAFAKETATVSYQAQKSFASEFKKASQVSWTATANYTKVDFVYEDERMEAFYNADGDKIGTTKSISIDLLPLKAKRAFAKRFGDYEVKESIVFEGDDETAYYISATKEKQSVVVKVSGSGETSIFLREKKLQ